METCFVIQPFDAGRYDKLYRDVYAPAIEAAGYKPYRVDKDPSVTVLIDSIESGIKSAIVCLADITEDNPNVWFELGYALASNRPVVMVCAENRQGRMFPFDIQHRPIILYKPESSSDFEVLKEAITGRIKAIVKKDEFLQKMSENEPVTPVAGLSPPEIMLVALLAGGFTHNSTISAWHLKEDAERAGITGVGMNLAVRRLLTKQFIEEVTEYEPYNNNEEYTAYKLLDRAWEWIEANEDRIVMLRASKEKSGDSTPY
jgi:predicted house-cleaning noncanonical NTP pyrophosphatase (MazG superfamily)